MALRPQDVPDLYLAPVALSLDAELEVLGAMDVSRLHETVTLRTNWEARSVEDRRAALVDAIRHVADLHGWTLGLSERGLQMTHDSHRLVLGLPVSLREYLQG